MGNALKNPEGTAREKGSDGTSLDYVVCIGA
jgi:hypothetical protein